MADFQAMRARFVRTTNRYDMITGTLAANVDAGAGDWVNAGARLLDQMLLENLPRQQKTVAVAATDTSALIAGMLTIERLTFIDAAGERTDVTGNWKSWEQFYFDNPQDLSTLTAGTPGGDWTVGKETDIDIAKQTTILWAPQSDAAYTMEIMGAVKSDTLSSDAHVNYWSVNYPEALNLASVYEFELTLGDRSAAEAKYSALLRSVNEVDGDGIMYDQWQHARGLED